MVSGGSAKTSYYFSGNYSNKTGILPGARLDRYNFREYHRYQSEDVASVQA